jgi:hypothetical protein
MSMHNADHIQAAGGNSKLHHIKPAKPNATIFQSPL